eukprot:s1957_g23.t1
MLNCNSATADDQNSKLLAFYIALALGQESSSLKDFLRFALAVLQLLSTEYCNTMVQGPRGPESKKFSASHGGVGSGPASMGLSWAPQKMAWSDMLVLPATMVHQFWWQNPKLCCLNQVFDAYIFK